MAKRPRVRVQPANFQPANFQRANLQPANLQPANLGQKATLREQLITYQRRPLLQ
ncbi:hypothetical protein [Moorena sp. SIO3I6]|uniref:hypothetical protein n=1 Tax=Moorena sp. SIO3I6 TaxID=2607831 RepID=UPI0013F871B0|nr:hypothetical protein [Moorena sp. SIO3I6]NEP29455.1 hypothetical protein [Moorena sp. SIO3I6]